MSHGPPQTITLDGYAASHRAVQEMKADGLLPKGTKRSRWAQRNGIFAEHSHFAAAHIASSSVMTSACFPICTSPTLG